jgi:hypothetical protein
MGAKIIVNGNYFQFDSKIRKLFFGFNFFIFACMFVRICHQPGIGVCWYPNSTAEDPQILVSDCRNIVAMAGFWRTRFQPNW